MQSNTMTLQIYYTSGGAYDPERMSYLILLCGHFGLNWQCVIVISPLISPYIFRCPILVLGKILKSYLLELL